MLDRHGQNDSVSIDRLKVAFVDPSEISTPTPPAVSTPFPRRHHFLRTTPHQHRHHPSCQTSKLVLGASRKLHPTSAIMNPNIHSLTHHTQIERSHTRSKGELCSNFLSRFLNSFPSLCIHCFNLKS